MTKETELKSRTNELMAEESAENKKFAERLNSLCDKFAAFLKESDISVREMQFVLERFSRRNNAVLNNLKESEILSRIK